MYAKKLFILSLMAISTAFAMKEITLKRGEAIKLQLDSNRTTGYLWQLAKPIDEHVVKIIDSGYEATKTHLIGSGGKQYWKVKGINPGITEINLEYKRSWEKNIKPVKEKRFVIKVK